MSKNLIILTLFAGCAPMQTPPNSPQSDAAVQSTMTVSKPAETAAPARDGNIAIREEFEAAKAKNTVQAYGLFIARHPDHALTKQAKELQARANK